MKVITSDIELLLWSNPSVEFFPERLPGIGLGYLLRILLPVFFCISHSFVFLRSTLQEIGSRLSLVRHTSISCEEEVTAVGGMQEQGNCGMANSGPELSTAQNSWAVDRKKLTPLHALDVLIRYAAMASV